MQKFKVLARRATAMLAAVGLLGAVGTTALPALVSADALNPLTERSLLLSSSSPGWSAVDGSGNPTYAPPNSGANGQKSGQTFTFRVSSTATIKAFTFQYCTRPAGQCLAPGDNSGNAIGGGTRDPDSATTSDLNVVAPSATEISPANWATIQARTSSGDLYNDSAALQAGIPKRDNSEGNFIVRYSSTATGTADTQSTGWTMTSSNVEEDPTTNTGKNNFITLKNSTGQAFTAGMQVQVTFFATDTNYITNPGSSYFFAKINDYNSDTTLDSTTLVDGGVTVANIMNESIQIQTKVLETMDFSVGIIDPNTLTELEYGNGTSKSHTQCDPILTRAPGSTGPANYLFIGNPTAEHSLETSKAWDTHSYWRLSSNSSGGATVYYSGTTLKNTVGDEIAPIGDTASPSRTGTEQFGLAIAQINDANMSPDYNATDNDELDASYTSYVTSVNDPVKAHLPQLAPLVPTAAYGGGAGTIVDNGTAKFAFNANANTVPVPIAEETTEVVNCVTAKMRYIGNIAATTPSGIYATKINYLAAPQY
jgi:hypothetical protein